MSHTKVDPSQELQHLFISNQENLRWLLEVFKILRFFMLAMLAQKLLKFFLCEISEHIGAN